MAYGTFTLTGTHQDPTGTPHAGKVLIKPNAVIRDSAGNVILSGNVEVALSALGSWSVVLPADDPTLSPSSGLGYRVTYRLHSSSLAPLDIAAQAAGTTHDVADLTSSEALAPLTSDTTVLDTSVAARVGDTGSATHAALDAAYARMAKKPTGVAATDTANLLEVAAGGGTIRLHEGTYAINATLPITDGMSWHGAGDGSTILALAAGANVDVFRTADFATLTETGSTGGPSRWSVRGLTIDGNRASNTTGRGITAFGYAFLIEDVTIRNAADDGMYTEWSFSGLGTDGMESRFSGVRIHDCGEWGWRHRGPHDSIASQVIVFGNNQDGGNFGGIWIENDKQPTQRWLAGGAHLSDVHVWGTSHKWALIAAGGCYITSSQFEGASVGQLLVVAPVVMRGGKVFNLTNNGRVPNIGIQFGDDGATPGYSGTEAWAGGDCNIDVHLQGFYGSARESAPIAWINGTNNAVRAVAKMASYPASYTIASGVGSAVSGLTTLALSAAPDAYPLAGQVTVPTSTGTATLAYTGVSGSSLTGVSVVSGSGNLSAGSATLVAATIVGTLHRSSFVNVRGYHSSATPSQIAAWGVDRVVSATRWQGSNSDVNYGVQIDAATGHIDAPGNGTAPTVAAHANLGTGGSVAGTLAEIRGQLAITSGSAGMLAGTAATVTLNSPYVTTNPIVIISPANAATAALNPYATSTAKGVFIVGFQTAPAAGQTYYVNYWIVG